MVRYVEGALDEGIYAALRQSVGWRAIPGAQARAGLAGGLYDLAAFEDGECVGMGRLVGDGAIFFHIVDLVVRPDRQGRGVGRGLLLGLLGWARHAIAPGCRGCVSLIAAEGKEGFYQRQGFEILYGGPEGSGMRLLIHRGEGA